MKDLFRIVSRRFMKDKKKAVSTLAIIITFVMVYTLIMPAVALERKAAENEPGIALEETVSGDAMAEAEPESLEAEAASAEESESESDAEAVAEEEPAAEEIAAESVVPAAEPAEDNSAVNDSSAAVQGTDAVSGQGSSRDTEVRNEFDGNQSAAEGSADPSVSDADETDAEEGMPAQKFEQTIKFNEIIDEEGNTVEKQVKVKVDAEKDAFPAGAVMKAEVVLNNIDPQRLQDMEDAIKEAVKKEAEKSGLNADNTRIVQYQAVEISFLNKEGQKIEPAKKVEVRITSDKIREIENPVLVHVNENDKTGAIKDADVIEKKDVALIDDQPDTIDNNENTMLFKTSRFSPFVIVESENVDENGGIVNGLEGEYRSEASLVVADEGNNIADDGSGVLMTSDGDYNVTVTYDANANIPANAELQVKEIIEASRAYQNYMEEAKDVLEDDSSSINYAKIIDVDIVSDGEVVTPEAEVDVDIAYKNSDEIEEGTVVQALQFGEGTPAVNDDAFVYGDETHIDGVQMKAVEIPVTAIVGTEVITATVLTGDGKTLKVTINYDKNAQIPEGATLDVKEIQEGDEGWFDRSVRLADVLSKNYGNVTLSDARFLSISIMVDGKEFEPKAPVQVKVEYEEAFDTEDTAEPFYDELSGEMVQPESRDNRFVAIHYTEAGPELIEAENIIGEKGISETLYNVDGFSDYDLVYMYDYEAYEAGEDYKPSARIHTADIIADLSNSNTKAAATKAAEPTRNAGDVPAHSKSLTDNNNGTYTIGLNVTGDADTENNTASNANVIIIYDTSTSMVAPGTNNNAERNNYVPMATGGRGIDTSGNNTTTYSDGLYFQLYRRNDSGSGYTALTNDNYSGTVYRRTGNGGWGQQYTYTEYTGQRYSYSIDRADASEKVVYDFTNALFGYQNQDDPTNIQAAFITFDGSAVNQTSGWTSTSSDITGKVSSTGNANSAKLSYHNYTNWTDALQMAENLINSTSTDNDPTYVVFITDGRPQTSSESAARPNYNSSKVIARRIEQACEETGGAFYGIFAFANDDDWLASLVSYAYNGTDPANPGTTFDTEGYYKASDTAALTQAINEIFQKIVQTLGVGEVQIADGTTSTVATSTGVPAHLLEVDEESYQYWLSFPVTAGSGGSYTLTMVNLMTGDPVNYTVTQSGENVTITWTDPTDNTSKTETYPGKIEAGNTLTIEWTEKTSFYNYDPPAASFNSTTGSVDWNLHPVGTLLDGVTYTVTFDCYPSQDTLDLIADLKNGDIQYSEVDSGIRQYLGEDYKLKTNTTATLSYEDTRPGGGSGSVDYVNPDPQPVNATELITVSKKWNNSLDNRTGWQQNLELYVLRDGEEGHAVELTENNHWTNTAYISYGIITTKGDKVSLKTTGHDFSFAEDVETGYYWVIKAPTIRPMLIDNEVTMLKLLKSGEDEIPDEITGATEANARVTVDEETYYKLTIDGEVEYYVVDPEGLTGALTATNHRRSYLDVVKTVTGDHVPEGDEFTFTMTVNNVNAGTANPDDPNSDAWVWFSIWDNNAGAMLIDPDAATASSMRWQLNDGTDDTPGTIVTEKPSSDDFNGYFCVPSETPITVNMQNGYSLRFLNLPDGSTYDIAESETMPAEGYSFVSIAGTRSYDEDMDEETTGDWKTDPAGTVSGQSISGTIEYVESAYKVEVTNKWANIDVKLKKVDQDGTILDGSTFTLTRGEDALGTYSPDSTTEDGNPIDLGGLGLGTYVLEETTVPANYEKAENVNFEVYKDTDGSLKARLTADNSNTDATITEETGDDGPIYTITVTNTRKTAPLNVSKVVDGLNADKAVEFEFIVTITGAAVTPGTITIGDETIAPTPDESVAGKYTYSFNLKDLEEITIPDIPFGATVNVEEKDSSGNPKAYELQDFITKYTIGDGNQTEGTVAELTYNDTNVTDVENGVTIAYNNTRNVQRIKVFKYETGSPTKGLEGAEFSLIGPEGSGVSYTGLTTNTDGYLVYDNSIIIELPVDAENSYQLTETKAPDGYNLITETIEFTVTKNGIAGSDDITPETETIDGVEVPTGVYLIKVQNSTGVELPYTGGPGTFLYTLGGLMLIIASALMYGFRMRRRERRLN